MDTAVCEVSCIFLFIFFLLVELRSTSMTGLAEGGVGSLPTASSPKEKGPGVRDVEQGGHPPGSGREGGVLEANPNTHPIMLQRMKASCGQVRSHGEHNIC